VVQFSAVGTDVHSNVGVDVDSETGRILVVSVLRLGTDDVHSRRDKNNDKLVYTLGH